MKFGEYMREQKVITTEQLEDALTIQSANPQLKLGEIFVAQGNLGNQELLDWIERYMQVTGRVVEEVTEWLSQEEADTLIARLRGEEQN